MDDFPVPACPKRTRPRSDTGLFTQLIMKSRNVTRVPRRQPLFGLNCEMRLYGISLIFATSSRIWNAVIPVEMVAWSKKAFRRLTRTSDNSLIFPSGAPAIFFNARFPENTMFTKANEADEDDVQNCESFAYDWIKSQQVQTSCSMRVRIR